MQHKFHNNGAGLPADKTAEYPVRRCDLSELVLGPLSDQIDQARIEILERIHELKESDEIMARQKKRELDDEEFR